MVQSSATRPTKRRINVVKWSLGCAGLSMMVFAGITMIALIVAPIVFRSLLPEEQARLTRHFPFLVALEPTQPYKYLPTFAATGANALSLLSTPVGTVAPARVVSGSGLSAGGDFGLGDAPTPISPTSTPILTTFTPTPLLGPVDPQPTEVLGVPTEVPTPTEIPVPRSFHNTSFHLVPQDWNACGPANLTQALQYYGWKGDQKEAARWLKPHREDKNVSPWQMVGFVNSKTGVKALMRVAGDLRTVKKLVSQKFAVILEMGYMVPDQGWMGHYATVVGYDDNSSTMFWLDTNQSDLNNTGTPERSSDFDARWQQFNRLYIVVYSEDRTADLAAVLGSDADPTYNAYHALSVARIEESEHPDNPFTWFNMGSSYVLLGQYKEAAAAFDQAFNLGGGRLPPRMLWYQFTPYEAYYNIGNYANVMALTTATLQTTPYVEETFYWRAMAEAAQGKMNSSADDFKRVLQFNPNFSPAADKLAQVQSGNFTAPGIAQAP